MYANSVDNISWATKVLFSPADVPGLGVGFYREIINNYYTKVRWIWGDKYLQGM